MVAILISSIICLVLIAYLLKTETIDNRRSKFSKTSVYANVASATNHAQLHPRKVGNDHEIPAQTTVVDTPLVQRGPVMSEAKDNAQGDRPPAPTRARTIWALIKAGAVWAATFLLSYLVTSDSLLFAVAMMFLIGFPASTMILRHNRAVIPKSVVKALDYVTLLTFVTGLIAVSDIDTQNSRERAKIAASNIAAAQASLQTRFDSQFDRCRQLKIQPPPTSPDKLVNYVRNEVMSYLSPDFFQQYIACFLFSKFQGRDLDKVPSENLGLPLMLFVPYGLMFGLLPRDQQFSELLNALEDYSRDRNYIEHPNPIGLYISRTLAYLLVAFAFSVRLTRTTLEVFEWHIK